jgi:hypothetical protein
MVIIQKLLILTGSLLALSLPLRSQVVRENTAGEKIVVYPDGQFSYFKDLPGQRILASGSVPYPVYNGTIEPLDGSVSLNEEDLFKVAVRQAQLSVDATYLAAEMAQQSKLERERLEQQLAGTTDEAVQHILRRQLTAAREREVNAFLSLETAKQTAVQDMDLVEKGGFIEAFNARMRLRKLEDLLLRRRQVDRSYTNSLAISENSLAPPPGFDLMGQPPQQDCITTQDSRDAATGEWTRQVAQRLLFTHTDERLRPLLKDKEYLRCEGFLSSRGNRQQLSLEFSFAYPNAREAYGFIESGSILTIKLLNGEFVNLRAEKLERGSYDTRKGVLTYRVAYPIDRRQLNILQQAEADFVRVFWSSGYEEYKIYQLDFFRQQLRCLEK